MNNSTVAKSVENLVRCHRLFVMGMVWSGVISIFMLYVVFRQIEEDGYGLAIYTSVMTLAIIWAGCILFREDRILSRLIVGLDVQGHQISIETVLGRQVIVEGRTYRVLDLAWLKKRRVWPSYFMPKLTVGISPRYDWREMQCIAIGPAQAPFYWVSNDKSARTGVQSALSLEMGSDLG